MAVVIETTLGKVTVNLFVDERPRTCSNFLKLCKIKYYHHNLFHNVTANFLAQTGDPTGKGDGGECIYGVLKGEEFRYYQGERQPKIKHDRIGLVSMVSHGNGLFGSQFFITLGSDLTSLDNEHCVFGHIVDGNDLLLKLNEAITDSQHRPYQDIRIIETVVLEDPYPDPGNLVIPNETLAKDAAYARIPANETLTEDYSKDELDEMVQAKEAAARATILEMIGDLPDAEIKPPENVLFVCKLNPVTTDNDLAIIFARFGKIKSCEIIRDSISGDSLQYAFIEFEEKKACEDAYFKMENVLIDDRRIHVDFSQSVAKWRGKGKGFELLKSNPRKGDRSEKESTLNKRPERSDQRGDYRNRRTNDDRGGRMRGYERDNRPFDDRRRDYRNGRTEFRWQRDHYYRSNYMERNRERRSGEHQKSKKRRDSLSDVEKLNSTSSSGKASKRSKVSRKESETKTDSSSSESELQEKRKRKDEESKKSNKKRRRKRDSSSETESSDEKAKKKSKKEKSRERKKKKKEKHDDSSSEEEIRRKKQSSKKKRKYKDSTESSSE